MSLIKKVNCEIEEKTVRVGKYKLHYVVAGKGKPLVLIHGANIGWGQWYPNIAELAKHHRVYAIDLPGSGDSSKVDFLTVNLDRAFIDTLDKFIREMKIEDVSIVGHSIGGWVAMKLAIKDNFKIKKIILINPAGLSRKMPNMYRMLAFKPMVSLMKRTVFKPSKKMVRSFFESSVVNPKRITDEFVEYYYQNLKEGAHPLDLMHRLSGLFFIKDDFVLTNEFNKIKYPILIIIGEQDKVTPKEDIMRNSKSNKMSRVKLIKNAGHVVGIDKAKLHDHLILEFLKD